MDRQTLISRSVQGIPSKNGPDSQLARLSSSTSLLRRAVYVLLTYFAVGLWHDEQLVAQRETHLNTTYVQDIPGTDVSFQMTYIQAGEFMLGSPATEFGRDEDEGPQRPVKLDAFWMSELEISYEVYAVFGLANQSSRTSGPLESLLELDAVTRPSPPYADPAHGMGNHGFPAVGMTQRAALEFAAWLSEKTGKLFRLPTEAEWEYACRAGSESAYSYGDDPGLLDAYAWYVDNSNDVFHRPGLKRPNRWGLYDMHGNVAEWTMDQYASDFYGTLSDKTNKSPWFRPVHPHPRTVRGGAYDDDAESLRCAARMASDLSWKRNDPQLPKSIWWNTDSPFVGFRLVRPVEDMTIDDIRMYWADLLAQ